MVSLKSQRNPYVIGRPINERQLFYGRKNELDFVCKSFQKGQKIVFLHGERRIGKTSLLQNIPEFLDENENTAKYACVSFDLEYHGRNTLESLLERLAETIVKQLNISPYQIEIPTAEEIKDQKDIFCHKFLPQIYARLKDTKLVLLLDEFDALEPNDIGTPLESLFKQLQNVVQSKNNQQLLAVIFAGRKSTDVSNLLKIFHQVPIRKIDVIDNESAKKLITEPAMGSLQFDQNSINTIINFSSGHPYFIQIICFALFSRARELEKWEVTQKDVEIIIERAVELAEAGLAWYWEALSVLEKLVFSAVAEGQKIALEKQDDRLKQNPLRILKIYNFEHLSEDTLRKIVVELKNRGFLNQEGNKVKIELVRRWLVQRHPLWQEIREFERADKQEIEQAYQIIELLNEEKKSLPSRNDSPKVAPTFNNNFEKPFSKKNEDFSYYKHTKTNGALAVNDSVQKMNLYAHQNWATIVACILGLGGLIAIFISLDIPRNSNPSIEHIQQQIKPNP